MNYHYQRNASCLAFFRISFEPTCTDFGVSTSPSSTICLVSTGSTLYEPEAETDSFYFEKSRYKQQSFHHVCAYFNYLVAASCRKLQSHRRSFSWPTICRRSNSQQWRRRTVTTCREVPQLRSFRTAKTSSQRCQEGWGCPDLFASAFRKRWKQSTKITKSHKKTWKRNKVYHTGTSNQLA